MNDPRFQKNDFYSFRLSKEQLTMGGVNVKRKSFGSKSLFLPTLAHISEYLNTLGNATSNI